MNKSENYSDQLLRLNPTWTIGSIRSITFQITEQCTLRCSYCYQIDKKESTMSIETARKCVDLLFQMYDEDNKEAFINKDTKAIILDFIGGEPLLNVKAIEYICDYFVSCCLKRNHPWLENFRISIISNGDLYFTDESQAFLEKWQDFLSFTITIDGPEEIHNTCRVNKNGDGNFKNAFAALKHYRDNYYPNPSTKVTIAPENLKDFEKIINFFLSNNITDIHINPAFEPEWTYEDAQAYYYELRKIANILLENPNFSFSIFREQSFSPLPETELNTYCGGNGDMLAFDPFGKAYPCVRYMTSSLGNDVPPLIIGDYNGLYITEEQKEILSSLKSITRRTENTDECFFCPIARGCGECSAWNYQSAKKLGCRNINICPMHKAASLANVYFWNKYYRLHKINARFRMFLSKTEALRIIDRTEYFLLRALESE
jgi:radical SAM peptide maturase (CXXX-repeat target family)